MAVSSDDLLDPVSSRVQVAQGLTEADIGGRIGVSRTQVSRLPSRTVALLRAGLGRG